MFAHNLFIIRHLGLSIPYCCNIHDIAQVSMALVSIDISIDTCRLAMALFGVLLLDEVWL